MKNDNNNSQPHIDSSDLNLSYYFSFEESSSTETQNQKQLKAVPLYTANEHEHSQDERPCALHQSVEFEYLEEPVELVASSYSGCDCKGCQSYKIELENAYEKIAAVQGFDPVDGEPVPASDKLLACAKRQLKTSAREAIEKPAVFVCEALRLVLIPFIVGVMIVLFSRGASEAANDTITTHANEFFSVVTLIFGFLISIKAMKTFQPVVLFGLSAKDLFKVLFLTKSVFFMTVIVKYLLPVLFFIITAQIGFYFEVPVLIMAFVLVFSLASVMFFFDDLNGFKLSEQIAIYKSRYNVQ